MIAGGLPRQSYVNLDDRGRFTSKNTVVLIEVLSFCGYFILGYLIGLPLRARRMGRQFAELDLMDISQSRKNQIADEIAYAGGFWHGVFMFFWPVMLFAPLFFGAKGSL